MVLVNRNGKDFTWVKDILPLPEPEGGTVIGDVNADGKNDLIMTGAARPWHYNSIETERRDANTLKTLHTYVWQGH